MTRAQFIQSRGRIWRIYRRKHKDIPASAIPRLHDYWQKQTAYLLDVKFDHTGQVPKPQLT